MIETTRRVWLVALFAGACFSEAPPLAGEGTTTGGEVCAIGSEGCFCTEGNGCDAGLECLLPVGVCVAEGCTLGAGLCGCDQGACAEGYKCVEDFCAPEGSATISDTGSVETSAPDDTGASADPSGATTMDPETGAVTTETSASEDSGDPTLETSSTTFEPATCGECIEHARDNACKTNWNNCTGCADLYDCFAVDMGGASCCPPKGEPQPINWQAFGICVDGECMELCGSISCL